MQVLCSDCFFMKPSIATKFQYINSLVSCSLNLTHSSTYNKKNIFSHIWLHCLISITNISFPQNVPSIKKNNTHITKCLHKNIGNISHTLSTMPVHLVFKMFINNSVALVQEQTIPSEWPLLVDEVCANFFADIGVSRGQRNRFLRL
jgi:hypothetical protein